LPLLLAYLNIAEVEFIRSDRAAPRLALAADLLVNWGCCKLNLADTCVSSNCDRHLKTIILQHQTFNNWNGRCSAPALVVLQLMMVYFCDSGL
jgi:hypothetical protein